MIKSFQIFLNMVLQKSKTLKIVLTRMLQQSPEFWVRDRFTWRRSGLKGIAEAMA